MTKCLDMVRSYLKYIKIRSRQDSKSEVQVERKYDTYMAKFLLMNHYGMTDKVESTVVNKDIVFEFGKNNIVDAEIIEDREEESNE